MLFHPIPDFVPHKEIGIGCGEDTRMTISGGYILAGILAALLHADM